MSAFEENTVGAGAAAAETVSNVENINTDEQMGSGIDVQTMTIRQFSLITRESEHILEKLLKEVLEIREITDDKTIIERDIVRYFPLYMTKYIEHLKKNGEYFPYEDRSGIEIRVPVLYNKNRKERNNRDEYTAYQTALDLFTNDLSHFMMDENGEIPVNIHIIKFNHKIKYYLYMNKWCITLYKTLKKRESVSDFKILLDCIMSYSRSIEELDNDIQNLRNTDDMNGNTNNQPMILYLTDFQIAYRYAFGKLKEKTEKIYKNIIYVNIFSNPDLLLESTWDKTKPSCISLYPEQREVLERIMRAVIGNEKLLLIYRVPPGNGKTMLTVPIGSKLNQYYTDRVRNRTIRYKYNLKRVFINEMIRKGSESTEEELTKRYIRDFSGFEDIFGRGFECIDDEDDDEGMDETKHLLYICHNQVVMNEVASLCNAKGVDKQFWFVSSEYYGDVEGQIDYLIRPYSNCFEKWRQYFRNVERFNAYRFGSLKLQWAFFQRVTKRRPDIIIADLNSALALMKEFPERFVPYFDETFAGSRNMVSVGILKRLPSVSVLVSATIPRLEEIPNILNNFKERHHCENESIIEVTSPRQHISCTIVGPDGCVYMPHNFVERHEDLLEYIHYIRTDPLKIRCYSPQIVYLMANHILSDLPEELHFHNKFRDYGNVRHNDVREYAMEILDFVARYGTEELFLKLVQYHPEKMKNMEKQHMLTENAFYYQDGNTLHVSSYEDFTENRLLITNPILEVAPRIKPVLVALKARKEANDVEIENIEQNKVVFRSRREREEKLAELRSRRFRINWSPELVPNSLEHGRLFGRTIHNPAISLEVDVEELKYMDEEVAKLLLSGVGLYDPETLGRRNHAFNRFKNHLKFIFSSPAIIYGTNLSISNVDVDDTFYKNATRNSIYQLMGRAGRRGKKSFNAMVVFHEWNSLRLVMNKDYIDIEANEAEEIFTQIE